MDKLKLTHEQLRSIWQLKNDDANAEYMMVPIESTNLYDQSGHNVIAVKINGQVTLINGKGERQKF
jgi:hypothetical protein